MKGRIRITSQPKDPIDVEKLVRALLLLLMDLEAAGEPVRIEEEAESDADEAEEPAA